MANVLALYLRSSVEQQEEKRNQNNRDESDTIANQRELLRSYAAKLGLDGYKVVEYVDDGHTGTNFRRPAFQKLIEDARRGKIQALIVKDFSRMGRDYIGVGDYMEQFFPSMGIRVISVNDKWDSAEHLGETLELDASFRTLLYDMYSRDLSKKRKSANQARNEKGVYTTSLAPYGYQKSENDSHQLVVDPEEAAVVRRIFSMFLSGMKRGDIAKILTREKISTPSMRNVEQKHTKTGASRQWSADAISIILRNEMYTGVVVTNRYEKEYSAVSVRKRNRSEWRYFPDRHEAIVSKTDFEKVRQMLSASRKETHTAAIHIAEKKTYPIYCGHCGRKLYRTTREEETLMCKNFLGNPEAVCGDILIRRPVLEKMIVELINLEARAFLDWSGKGNQESAQIEKLTDRIKELHAEAKQLKQKRMELYGAYREGSIEKERFLDQKLKCLQMEEECIAECEAAEAELKNRKEKRKKKESLAQDMREYMLLSHYDKFVCNKLIDRIEVFHDGKVSVKWKFSEDFPEYCSNPAAVEQDITDHPVAAVYSSDMRFMEEENDGKTAERAALRFCLEQLGVKAREIDVYYDKRNEEKLFYHQEYMKLIAMARSGRYQYVVIRRFSDLYLSQEELHNFLYWTLPLLPCRLISVEDHFDTKTEGEKLEKAKKDIYQKYHSVRKSDIMRYRAKRRAAGLEKAKPPVEAKCVSLYGYYRDEKGCYADEAALKIVKQIFRMFLAGYSHKQIFRYLNDHSVPTASQFFQSHGMDVRKEKNHRWNGEKLWMVTRNERYAEDCPYRFLCERDGKHCERQPIIDKADFCEVNRLFQYRNRS